MSGSGSPQRSLVPAEERLRELGIQLPPAPTPFGAYVPAVQTGNLLFLSGMLPTVGHEPRVLGCLGKDVDVDSARSASRIAALNALAVRQAASRHSRSGMSCRSSRSSNCDYWRAFGVRRGSGRCLRVAAGRSRRGQDVLSFVIGVASLPLGVPIELELIFEVQQQSE